MGTHLNRLGEAVLTSAHNLCFEQKCEKSEFLSENFQFLVMKFSIYLNRCVFVMLNVSDGLMNSECQKTTQNQSEADSHAWPPGQPMRASANINHENSV